MKMKFKAFITLTLVVCLLAFNCISAFAATYTYSTQYTVNDGKVATKVTAKASDVAVNSQVTYYATNSTGNVVYVDQQTAESGSAEFNYIADSDDVVISNMKFGGSGESTSQTVTDEDAEGYYTVNVYLDNTFNSTASVEANDSSDFTGKLLARSISIDLSDKLLESVSFKAAGGTDEIDITDECVYMNGVLTIYSNVITSDGDVLLTTDNPEAAVFLGDQIWDETAKSYTVLFKVKGDVSEYGIFVSALDGTYDGDFNVSDSDITDIDVTDGELRNVVKFRALGKASDGSAAVSLIDEVGAEHFAKGKYVRAYCLLGDGSYRVSSLTYVLK